MGGGGGRPVWWVRESTGERSAGGRHHCAAPHERVVAVAGGQARATDGTVNWQHGFGKDVARFGEEERGRLGALDSRTCRRRDCLAAEPRRKRSSSRGAGRRGEASSFLALARSLVVRNSGSFCAWGLVSYVCAVAGGLLRSDQGSSVGMGPGLTRALALRNFGLRGTQIC